MILNTNKFNQNKADKIVLISKYILREYILNCNLVKKCARTIGHIDVEKIRNNIYNNIDKDLLDNKRLHLSKIMPVIFKTYFKEKYYYNLKEWYFFIKYILDIDITYITIIFDLLIYVKNICLSFYNKRFEILNKLLGLESYHRPLCVGNDIYKLALYCAKDDVIKTILEWGYIAYSYRPVELFVDTIRLIYGYFVKREDDKITLSKIIFFIDLMLYFIFIFNMKTWTVNY